MMVRMVHPLHGIHIAYTESEVKENEKNGWVREAVVAPVAAPEAAPVAEPPPVFRRGPGRPRRGEL